MREFKYVMASLIASHEKCMTRIVFQIELYIFLHTGVLLILRHGSKKSMGFHIFNPKFPS